MSTSLISALHQEERSIVAELRASRLFQRLEGVRKLLSLYDEQPTVAVGIEGLAEAERAPVAAAAGGASLRMVPPTMGTAPTSQPIAMPGPTAAPAEAVSMSHAPITAQAVSEAGGESTSVVSSVRAALLGIGKP